MEQHLRHVHVGGQAVLGYPRHVLPRSDVNLGHTIGRIFVEHDGDLPCVDTPSHVLLEWTLENKKISIRLSIRSLLSR